MRYKIPLKIIELDSENYHLVVQGKFSDGTQQTWVIDTGASKSVFDKNQTRHFTIEEDQTEELHSAGIHCDPLTTGVGYMKSFYLGNFKVDYFKIALLDLSHINDLYSRSSDLRICGLLGSDFLVKYNAIINYKKKEIILRK